MPSARVLGVLSLLALLPVACGPAGAGSSAPAATAPAAEPFWQVEVAADLGEKLDGCAIGDVDADHPGNEIVVTGASGTVTLIERDEAGWIHRVLGRAPGETIQVALGDLDQNRPGDEVVVVGMASGTEDDGGPGAAHVLFRDGDAWVLQRIADAPALLHAVCVADLDGTPGPEVLVAGFAQRARMLSLEEDGWHDELAAELPGAGKNAVAHGDGVALACNDGSVVLLRHGPDGWSTTVRPAGPEGAGAARLASDGERLLVARDDGGLALLLPDGTRTDIFHDTRKLRGAVLANLDPLSPGLEAATTGYSGDVTVLRWSRDGWSPDRVAHDDAPLHHLAAGTLSSAGPGVFLVACGHGGRVLVIHRED